LTRVTLKYFASVREALGASLEEAEIAGGRVADVLDWLVANHGDALIPSVFDGNRRLRKEFRLLHNGSVCPPRLAAKEKIADGDEIVLVPPVAGG
jgi:MoaD family protein